VKRRLRAAGRPVQSAAMGRAQGLQPTTVARSRGGQGWWSRRSLV